MKAMTQDEVDRLETGDEVEVIWANGKRGTYTVNAEVARRPAVLTIRANGLGKWTELSPVCVPTGDELRVSKGIRVFAVKVREPEPEPDGDRGGEGSTWAKLREGWFEEED